MTPMRKKTKVTKRTKPTPLQDLLNAVDYLTSYYENGDGGLDWDQLDFQVANLIRARNRIKAKRVAK